MKTYKELQKALKEYKQLGLTDIALNSNYDTLLSEYNGLELAKKLNYNFEVLKYDQASSGICDLDSPSNYIGSKYDGYLTLTSSYPHDLISEFNYEYFQKWLQDEKIEYDIVQFGHWLVGNYERIGIPIETNLDDLIEIDDLLSGLKDYPILDDSGYSQYEYGKYQEYFELEGFELVVKSTFLEFIDTYNYDFSDEFILETWIEFCYQCNWEYEVEQSYFIMNDKDYYDFLCANYSHLVDKDKTELYYANKNPNQLSLV